MEIKEEEQKTSQKSSWTKDELILLSKAVVKFPGGTQSRWQRVADYIGDKTSKEVIAKSKEIQERRQRVAEEKKEQEQK